MRKTARACAILFLLGLGAPCAANIAAPHSNPASASAPARVGAESIRVRAERLSFSCREKDGQPQCDFEAVYLFENRSDAPAATPAAFYGLRLEEVSIRQGEKDVGREIGEDLRKALDEAVQKSFHPKQPSIHALDDYLRDKTIQLDRAGFRLELPPAGQAEIAVAGRMKPEANFRPSYVQSAVFTRHVYLGSQVEPGSYEFEYLVAPIRTWGPAPVIQVRLEHPADWQSWIAVDPPDGIQRRVDGPCGDGRRCVSFSLPAAAVDSFRFGFHVPEPWIFHGGPMLGIGGNVDDSGGFRMRFGYELAAPAWLFWSLALDTDFDREIVLAPVAEAALPGVFFVFPSLAIGAGVPVRLKPGVQVGIRVQLSMQWMLAGFVTAFDVYPGLSTSDPLMFQASLLGQIAL
ncbi:MAG: hypothetical protein JXR96_25210 [Deltaproteobacteria bacterium]|nr:hypothetical protein [Deltaproteobacteria bacterium]